MSDSRGCMRSSGRKRRRRRRSSSTVECISKWAFLLPSSKRVSACSRPPYKCVSLARSLGPPRRAYASILNVWRRRRAKRPPWVCRQGLLRMARNKELVCFTHPHATRDKRGLCRTSPSPRSKECRLAFRKGRHRSWHPTQQGQHVTTEAERCGRCWLA